MVEPTSVGPRMRGATFRSYLLSTLILLLAALTAGCGNGESASSDELFGMTRTPALVAAGASLPQVNPERPTGEQPLRGPENGLLLLFFGFTHCPDICPTTMADLRVALDELSPEERERIQVGFATVDPDRDTPRVLNRYLNHFFKDGNFDAFVPANAGQLARAEKPFEVKHEYGEKDARGNYDVGHSAQVFAVSNDGTVLVEWPFGSPAADIAGDIRLLIEQLDSEGGLS